MMWELIAQNKRRSAILLAAMAVCLLGLGASIGMLWDPEIGVWIGLQLSGILWIIMSLMSLFAGDSILLASSGAKEITREQHPQLFNIVEEMKIASNLPAMPKLYVMEDLGMNAFATGLRPEKSAIAVTAGLLSRMNRDELQGVIAHEMSHIMNRDILYMTLAGVMLGSIQLMTRFFLRSFLYGGGKGRRYRGAKSSGGGGGGAGLALIVLALAFSILGPVLAQIFYFSLSRKREYLADACAARLTRYPEGLASALEKIAGYTSHLNSANAITAPMYIAHPFGERPARLMGLMSTHPPIQTRVEILRALSHGVSLTAYQAIYAKILKKKPDLLPASGLKDQSLKPLRAPSAAETERKDDKKNTRQTLDLLRAVNQYAFLFCVCGLKIKLPPDFKDSQLPCPRCGQTVSIPQAQILTAAEALEADLKSKEANKEPSMKAVSPNLEYRRQGKTWETFACACGAYLQISPVFEGTHLTCRQCQRQVNIL